MRRVRVYIGVVTATAVVTLAVSWFLRAPAHWPSVAVLALLCVVSTHSRVRRLTASTGLSTGSIVQLASVVIVGPTGAGKSTFLRLLLREEVPTKGRVYVSNFDVAKMARRRIPRLRQSIGCVFQDFRLLTNKTVAENVAFALEVIGKPRHTINRVVPEVLQLVGLDGKANRMPHELSGGEQQRVAIARAFVNRPAVLIADEPTGNLDPDTSQDIMLLLERINRTGTTVLMATHDHSIVDSMRRRVVELGLGQIVRDDKRGVYGVGR